MTIAVRKFLFPVMAGLLISGCANPFDRNIHSQYARPHAAQYYAPNAYAPTHYTSTPAGYTGNAYGYHPQTGQMMQAQPYPQAPQYASYAPQNYAPQSAQPAPYLRGAYQAPRSRLNLNYETLSAFEAPLAVEIGDVTFLLRGRVDAPLEYSFENEQRNDRGVIGNYQISAETQLPNRLTVGAVYAGRVEDINGAEYDDEVAGYIGGSWGTVFGGNVSDLVFEETRRKRGVTDVALAGDGALGGLGEWSGGYRGRYGPVKISGVIDEDANYDVGVSFQRPIGNKDYRIAARHNNGSFVAADGITEVDTKALTAVGEYVYGSTRYDIGGGVEQLSIGSDASDRWFASAGFATKKGVWSLSGEGQIGAIDGHNESSAVVGIRYDIARGLAATAAIDYQDRQINIGGVDYINTKDTRGIMALIYGF